MKKIIALIMLTSVFSCTPYQKLMFIPSNRNQILQDPCDVRVMNQLRQSFDTIDLNRNPDHTGLLEQIIEDFECGYYATEFYPPREDSTLWLMTIRPVTVDNEEIILGNLYTFYPQQDSTFIFYRRVKPYTQKKVFESGKYMVFTYFADKDTTMIVKVGARKF